MLKHFRFGFDWKGLILFLAVMIPNFIWFACPAPHDVLRSESLTGTADTIGSVCQVLMVACLCLIRNRRKPAAQAKGMIPAVISCVFLYFLCWVFYYLGHAGAAVLTGLTVFPCAAFLLYACDRRNWIAAYLAGAFSVCHLIHTAVNFLFR